MNNKIKTTICNIVKSATPRALSTIWWILRITTLVSFIMFVLKYTGILNWISALVSPLFQYFGLPGDAAMAYVSGYFINVYSAIAVISTLEFTAREITILGTMVLAAHAMFIETALQHKTGSPSAYVFILRTIGSILLGVILNLILPGRPEITATGALSLAGIPFFDIQGHLGLMFWDWFKGMAKLAVMMFCLIYTLNIIQRTLYELGIMEIISRILRPLLRVFGLADSTSFIWIVANVSGISYGAAAILDELDRGKITTREINLLNTHIGISHSNLEDLTLLTSVGGACGVMLLARWALVIILVWALRLYYHLKDKRRKLQTA